MDIKVVINQAHRERKVYYSERNIKYTMKKGEKQAITWLTEVGEEKQGIQRIPIPDIGECTRFRVEQVV